MVYLEKIERKPLMYLQSYLGGMSLNRVWTYIPCHVLCVLGQPCLGERHKHVKQVNEGHPGNLNQSSCRMFPHYLNPNILNLQGKPKLVCKISVPLRSGKDSSFKLLRGLEN